MSQYLKYLIAATSMSLSFTVAAADNNSPQAGAPASADSLKEMVAQAKRYEHAEGVPRDYERAHALYCAAAKSGDADGLYSLGWMYANSRGVARDDGIASRLFKMAADKGYQHAQELMRHMNPNSSAALPACLTAQPARPKVEEQAALVTEANFPRGPIYDLVAKLAPRYEIDPRLALAVISVESGFNVKAKSPKNAQGLMQLMPGTAQRFRVKNTYDAEENIKGGLAYLQWLLAFFKGNVTLVAAAYNAGEGAVETYRGVPPYRETRDYVRKITSLYKKDSHPYKPSLVEASLILNRPLNGK
jgi:soluble lytic murein transglycosylase-like protein